MKKAEEGVLIYFITVNIYRFCISVIGYINMQIIGIGYKTKINIGRSLVTLLSTGFVKSLIDQPLSIVSKKLGRPKSDNLVAVVIDEAHVAYKWWVCIHGFGYWLQVNLFRHQFSSRRLSRRITKRYVIGLRVTPRILKRPPPPPRESKRLLIMPFQTLSTKQSEVAVFGITRLPPPPPPPPPPRF